MRNKNLFVFFLVAFLISTCLSTPSVYAQKRKLTYKQVYMGGEPRLLGSLPRIMGWLDKDHYLELKTEDTNGKPSQKLLKINAETGEETTFLDYGEYDKILPKGFSLYRAIETKDHSHFIFEKDNDLYYFSKESEEFKQLTENESEEKNPTFSPNGKWVAFTRDHNLFVLEFDSGKEHQLTFDGSDVVYNGWASWVYYEEIFGRSSRYRTFWWSPNSEMIAFMRFDDSEVPEFPLFRAEGTHGDLEITRYPKAGDPNPGVKLGIIHLDNKKTVWVDSEGNSEEYIAFPFWSTDSNQLFFQWMNRGQDNLKIFVADPKEGKKTKIYSEIQPSWVEWFEQLHFLENKPGFIFKSNRDGWAHLYHYNPENNSVKQLTRGNWRVNSIALIDEDNEKIYFQRSLGNLLENHLFVMDLDGDNMQQLTEIEGRHYCDVSPGGKYFIDRYSNIHQPTKIDLQSTAGEMVRNLGDQRTPEMDEYDLGQVELFTIPTEDGFDLPAIWVLPHNFDQSKKYPVLFRIYGGPGAGSVSNSFLWTSWYYMAQNDIIVMAVDHRGTGHFGKNGIATMHRNLGKWEMHDYIAAVKWLRQKSFVDSAKIGITGGSYGGYATCMALTYGADYFTHGIANFSVTDWKLYDTVYTERYMDTPEENPEGYEFGSVLTHADKYKGTMLITHGTMDDNVHMQNTIQLIDKFEDLNKDFELLLYPGARHGVGGKKRQHFSRENVQYWFRHFLGKELDVETD